MFVSVRSHVHDPLCSDALAKCMVSKECKQAAVDTPFKPSGSVVQEVLAKTLNRKRVHPDLPKVSHLFY